MPKKDFNTAFKNISKRFDNFVEDSTEQKKIASTIKSELVSNLRSGLGSDDKPLPDLSESWIEKRKQLAELNKTNSKYSPEKSNVTFTGKFVRALKVTIGKGARLLGFGTSFSTFDIEYTGNRPAYKTKKARQKRRRVENSDIFEGLSSRGWKLAGVTKNARIRIAKQFRRYIRRRRKR